ncbi:hypothetical protein CEQ21_07325 (plasmid) [Niallia circulans]|uniref:DUF4320 family protein n=1 Tax=Niallia circulans TaxID=1397 RepID=A0A553SQU1_NIACI|nr:hypothetical protein [Niallia circulans]TRZ39364.1 hypothetical protein CEQ21_07325 [Niallia circulans]
MQEGAVMEFFKWFLGLTLFMGLISFAMLCFDLGNINSFKQQVNYQIERQGGLTETAVANLDEYSKKYYHGNFTVESDQLNQKVSYGDPVDYTIKATFDVKIFPLIPDLHREFSGTGVSQVR